MNPSISAEEDLADVTRVLAGDVQAFEGIVRRWQGPLVNMAWRYCRDRGRAEDLAQEAFLRAWRGLAVSPPGSLRWPPMSSVPSSSGFPPSTCPWTRSPSPPPQPFSSTLSLKS